MTLEQYIDNIDKRYRLGNATEHTFRGDLQQLIESLVPEIRATNEPKRQSCGAPDYILTKKDNLSRSDSGIPVGFIEAKDIGDKDLDGTKKTGNKEQFDRYKASLNNLIFTDYLSFHLYRDGELITKISIGEITEKGIKPLLENFGNFENLIKDFCVHVGQTIKSSKKLAEMMAGKARLLSDVIEKSLTRDEEKHEDSTLKDQMTAFRDILIHDITPQGFADVYAQTIAYGMFAARLHDPTLATFSRQEAAELIPKSNPFLRKLFGYIAGPDIDDRIKWIVDSLTDIFLACNVEEILKNYGKQFFSPSGGGREGADPIIHFYETFLSEYDPKLRKARGVWYTPAPVVNFIVRAVDDILKTEFDLPQGLADTSKTKIKVPVQTNKGFQPLGEQEVHRVQILDPATGTGTFLAEVVKHIHKKFQGQQGIWSNYVETHLLPRLNGFELLMASYAMAHLKLDLLLKETGYKNSPPSQGGVPEGRGGNQRLRVYLTNSLEESHPDTGTLFANWLSTEANEANHIKRDTPVMCIIGNPPYSGESANKGEWIMKLMEDYKKEPGGKEKLKERNPKWINDDYVKFLRYGQHFIEKNGSGILAFINPHGFLDNPTFRGMRWNLLKTYDKIYTIDLHGNSKKKETAPDGSADTNVFDIQQGVSINIFIKTGKKSSPPQKGGVSAGRGGKLATTPSPSLKGGELLAKVFHYDLYGKRDFKYDFLNDNSIQSIDFKELPNVAPMYFMVQKDFETKKSYDKGFSITDLFSLNNVGVVTSRDSFVIDERKVHLKNRISDFFKLSKEEILQKFEVKENKVWKIDEVKNKAIEFKEDFIEPVSYRPFDNRFVYYNDNFIERSRNEVMQHFLKGENVGLVTARQCVGNWQYVFCTKLINEFNLTGTAGRFGSGNTFPLYLYPDEKNKDLFAEGQSPLSPADSSPKKGEQPKRVPNLNPEIVKQIAEKLGLEFVAEKTPLLTKEGLGVVENNHSGVVENKHFGVVENNQSGAAENSPPNLGGVWGGREKINNLPHLKTFRKELRNNLTPAEATLWKILKGKQLDGRKFRRQHSIDNYILDFYCPSERIAIELDGQGHFEENQSEYDRERDLFLEHYGIRVLRFENKWVWENQEGLIENIRSNFGKTTPTPPYKGGESIAPIDILDYIYAVLHSPSYREKYKEFLKIDFPRVPYPKDQETFWQLVKLGGEIRQIHLLESPKVEQYITQYPIDGDNVVVKPRFVNYNAEEKDHPTLKGTPPKKEGNFGKVFINDTQYFDNVPNIAWEFYIGGYQPAQKWLKDRKDRKLEFDDILHYQKIIVALSETDRLMKEIDEIKTD